MNPTTTAPAAGTDWQLTLIIIVGFFTIFPLFWCGVVWLLSRMSGWHRLAAHYASGSRTPTGTRHGGITGMVGGVSYRSTLTFYFEGDGFFMEVMVLFRIGQPRLFIPWSEVSSRREFAVLWWRAVALSVGAPSVGTISIPAHLMEKYAPPA